MYADDHLPPHFHVWTPDGEGLVLIDNLTLSRGLLRRQDFEVATDWARNNISFLREYWTELNG